MQKAKMRRNNKNAINMAICVISILVCVGDVAYFKNFPNILLFIIAVAGIVSASFLLQDTISFAKNKSTGQADEINKNYIQDFNNIYAFKSVAEKHRILHHIMIKYKVTEDQAYKYAVWEWDNENRKLDSLTD